MSKYAVKAGYLSASIFVGRINTQQDAFLDKEEATDMSLAAVAQYVHEHFNGGMVADFPGLGLVLEVNVRPIDPPA